MKFNETLKEQLLRFDPKYEKDLIDIAIYAENKEKINEECINISDVPTDEINISDSYFCIKNFCIQKQNIEPNMGIGLDQKPKNINDILTIPILHIKDIRLNHEELNDLKFDIDHIW